MSLAEATFYSHLTDVKSLDVIVREGFTLDAVLQVLPTEVGRKMTLWAIEKYFESGRLVAPSKAAIMATWGDQLVPLEIEIDDENELDSIQWAIEQLRSEFAIYTADIFTKALATSVRQADPQERAFAVVEGAQLLHSISQSLISRKNEQSADDGLDDAIFRYEDRHANGNILSGLTFGLPEVDDHTLGVHPGELAIVAGTAGGGKSWFTLMAVLEEYKRKRKTILYTIENDLEMSFDRLACVHCKVPYDLWQRGDCSDDELRRVKDFAEEMRISEVKPLFVHPQRTEATGSFMIRRAEVEGADSVIIDQLSHIQAVAGSKVRERNLQVAEIVKDLKFLISDSSYKLPLLLMHQINRKGREDARKTGRLLMDHMGEATEVENGASLIYGIYQSPDHVVFEQAELQCLKFRRGKKKDFEIEWRPAVGHIKVRKELDAD